LDYIVCPIGIKKDFATNIIVPQNKDFNYLIIE
jgi:hypothetical protein